ncbi:unnamed protein product, partial [Scytosiphon promiscuus]
HGQPDRNRPRGGEARVGWTVRPRVCSIVPPCCKAVLAQTATKRDMCRVIVRTLTVKRSHAASRTDVRDGCGCRERKNFSLSWVRWGGDWGSDQQRSGIQLVNKIRCCRGGSR